MKKVLSILAVAAMLVAVAACGNKKAEEEIVAEETDQIDSLAAEAEAAVDSLAAAAEEVAEAVAEQAQ